MSAKNWSSALRSMFLATCSNHTSAVVMCAVVAVLVGASGCKEENWNLVSPPPGGDSIVVRFVNMCGDGTPRSLSLDSKVITDLTPDTSASAFVSAPADSAFVSVLENGAPVYSMNGRVRFAKQSTELLIAVPTLPSSQQPKAIDTVLQFNTSRLLLPQPGFAQVRLIVAGDDITTQYTMREGCPNGEQIGSAVAVRQGSAYSFVPEGSLVFSLIRGNTFIGTYSAMVSSRGSYSVIVSKKKNAEPVVLTLNEDLGTAVAMRKSVPVPVSERLSLVRVINAGSVNVDSIVANGNTRVVSDLNTRAIGSYMPVLACAGSSSDEFKLYSSGAASATASTALSVSSRYSLVCYDSSAGGSGSGSGMGLVLVPPTRTQTPKDSVTVRVVHCAAAASAATFRVRMGARTDDAGQFHNGELIAVNLKPGTVSGVVRLAPGVAPVTVLAMSSGGPDYLRATCVSRFMAGKEYLIVITQQGSGSEPKVSIIESEEQNAQMREVPAGVFTQIVQARNDKAATTVSIGSVVKSAGLTFGNALATVLPHGSETVTVGGVRSSVQADSSRRLTMVATGDNSGVSVIELNEVSMSPAADTAKSRYLNATKDVARVRVSIDSVTNLGYNVYADDLEFGKLSPLRAEVKPRRINFVVGNAVTLKEILRPTYSLTLLAGKAYTVVVCGSQTNGYSLIIHQEY
jgi:hypothetical protein